MLRCSGGLRERLGLGRDLRQHVVELVAGERPLQRPRDVAVVLAEVHQATSEFLQRAEVVGCQRLALDDREEQLGLVEPGGVDGQVDQLGVDVCLVHPRDRGLAGVRAAVVDDPEHPPGRAVGLDGHDLLDEAAERDDPGRLLDAIKQTGVMHVPCGEVGQRAAAVVGARLGRDRALKLLVAGGLIGALADPQHIAFYLGIGVGAAAASVLCLWDSPPAHIERWRQGAQGEQQTARALRPLARDGWIVLNDLPRQYGNIDHVAIGPPGVFLVETKNIGGLASVTDDALIVRWLEDPDDGYTNTTVGRRARGAAAELSRTLGAAGERTWVQAIVVLWGRFEQERHEEQRVIWTHGSQLTETLRSQTAIRLTPAAVAQLADHIRAAASRTSTDVAARPTPFTSAPPVS